MPGILDQLTDMTAAANFRSRTPIRPPFMRDGPGMGMLDALAIGTSTVPGVGDLTGLLADINTFANNPESRTPSNFGLATLALLPFFPSLGVIQRAAPIFQAALKNTRTGRVTSGAPVHAVLASQIKKEGGNLAEYTSGFLDQKGSFLTREQAFDEANRTIPDFEQRFARASEDVNRETGGALDFLKPRELESQSIFDVIEGLKRGSQ